LSHRGALFLWEAWWDLLSQIYILILLFYNFFIIARDGPCVRLPGAPPVSGLVPLGRTHIPVPCPVHL